MLLFFFPPLFYFLFNLCLCIKAGTGILTLAAIVLSFSCIITQRFLVYVIKNTFYENSLLVLIAMLSNTFCKLFLSTLFSESVVREGTMKKNIFPPSAICLLTITLFFKSVWFGFQNHCALKKTHECCT